MNDMEYSKPYLGELVTIQIDRPLGSVHPRYGYLYPVNYGYVPNTKAPDGAELDAYVLGEEKPLDEFKGRCIAIVHRINDDDDKLIVCRSGVDFDDEQIRTMTHFQEQYFESEILRK